MRVNYDRFDRKLSKQVKESKPLFKKHINRYKRDKQLMEKQEEMMRKINGIEKEKMNYKPIMGKKRGTEGFKDEYEQEKQRYIRNKLDTVYNQKMRNQAQLKAPAYILKNIKVQNLEKANLLNFDTNVVKIAKKLTAVESTKQTISKRIRNQFICENDQLNTRLTGLVTNLYADNHEELIERLIDELLEEEVEVLNEIEKKEEQRRLDEKFLSSYQNKANFNSVR